MDLLKQTMSDCGVKTILVKPYHQKPLWLIHT